MSDILTFGTIEMSIHEDGTESVIVDDKKLKVIDIGTNGNRESHVLVQKPLYIYHIHRFGDPKKWTKCICYGMVVCSESEEKARRIHPNGYSYDEEKKRWYKTWPKDELHPEILEKVYTGEDDLWVESWKIDTLRVKRWGIALQGEEGDIIMYDIAS